MFEADPGQAKSDDSTRRDWRNGLSVVSLGAGLPTDIIERWEFVENVVDRKVVLATTNYQTAK